MRKFGHLLFLGVLLTGSSTIPSRAASDIRVTNLRCEGAAEPLGIDVPTPKLSWILQSPTRGQKQTAYRILAASTRSALERGPADLWDSGEVQSDQTTAIPYAGKPLTSSSQVFWKVLVRDKDGQASEWSPTATWIMGILSATDWHATWIGATATQPQARDPFGYHAGETRDPDDRKWVQVDLGKSAPVSSVRLIPMDHANRKGFGFPVRFKIELANEPAFNSPVIISDHTAGDFPNPGLAPVTFAAGAQTARYVRVTATRLWKFDERCCFALSQLEALSNGTNIATGSTVTYKDSVEAYGWGHRALTDGQTSNALPTEPEPATLLLRREFRVHPGLLRAIANVCGLGCYELSVNASKVGDALFPPGWTKYDRTCLYDTYDLTPLLRQGENCVGLLLGNGMYNVTGGRYVKFKGSFGPKKAIAQIRLEYRDGTVEFIGTDPQWRTAPGPITFSCVYGGEDFDARLQPTGWNQSGFDDTPWKPALAVTGPGGKLKGLSCASPPIKTFEVLAPIKVRELRTGVAVYDLGQNASIMPRLKVRGAPGSSVRITPAELVLADGSVDRSSCGRGAAYWQYTLAGGGLETWFPKFYYHGARYLQVERQSPEGVTLPEIEGLDALVVHANCEPIGDFECSKELFNRIRKLVRWAQRSNMMSVMTDCPHREKLGWLEEDHLNGPSLRFEFDLNRLFSKIMNDMADSQLENGLVPDIAPEYVKFNGGFRDSPEWGSAAILVPWQQYLFTGDLDLLERYFPRMQAYVEYLSTRSTNHIVSHGLGDWYDIGPKPPGVAQLTPVPLTATAFYYFDAWVLSRAAQLLGKQKEAAKYESLASDIRRAFNTTFFDAATGRYATGSQTANAIVLVMNLAESQNRSLVLSNLVANVRAHSNSLTAGDVGYRYLLRALADGDRSDVIFDINNQSDKPGYGYQLKMGATSLTEAWDAGPRSSQNHFMLGQITEWFYHDLAGIQPDPNLPGFKRAIIKPSLVGDVTWTKARYRSVRGEIKVEWSRNGENVSLGITIPANTTAQVYLPAAAGTTISESTTPVQKVSGVKVVSRENNLAILNVESGSYTFQTRNR